MDLSIPKIILDPANEEEVIDLAYSTIRSASQGRINDFSPSSPIAALIEGQAFVYMELLWYLNQLPTALALETFRLLGVERSPGNTAKGTVVFLLNNTLVTDFIVPAGYFIPFRDAGFVTTGTLFIPAGSLEGSVNIEATVQGTEMNIGAYGISNTGESLTYLNSIYNPEPVNGGVDLEPLEDTVQRAQLEIRSRGTLISISDYEAVAEFLLGSGSHATAFPLLTANKNSMALGHIHVFVLDANIDQPSVATCQSIQAELRERSFVGSSIWVSPADIRLCDVEVAVRVDALSEGLADVIYAAMIDRFNPKEMPLGAVVKVKELEFVARQQEGVNEVLAVSINNATLNYPMPSKYTQAKLAGLNIVMLDPDGIEKVYYRGEYNGDVDPD